MIVSDYRYTEVSVFHKQLEGELGFLPLFGALVVCTKAFFGQQDLCCPFSSMEVITV